MKKILLYLYLILLISTFVKAEPITHQSPEYLKNIIIEENSIDALQEGYFKKYDGYLSHGNHSLINTNGGKFSYFFELPRSGYYKVYSWWPVLSEDINASVNYHVQHGNGWKKIPINQNTMGGQWNLLGVFFFEKNSEYSISLENTNKNSSIVDALRVEFIGSKMPELNINNGFLPIAIEGEQYKANIIIEGGDAPYFCKITKGLPLGLYLDENTGLIRGIPKISGKYKLHVEVSDANFNFFEKKIDLLVVQKGTDKRNIFQTESAYLLDETSSKENFPSEMDIQNDQQQSGNLSNLIAILQNLPEGDWVKVNTNFFSDVWTPADLRPLNLSSNPTPSKIILAWSSFAWDSKRGDLIIYGGGHANYSGNDVYRWRGNTQQWERASLPSEIIQDDFGNWQAVDGSQSAPSSAHTYDNNVYLPIIDRFVAFGGAAYNNGGAYITQVNSTTTRRTGPYFFDPSKADPWKVGGTTGSHVQRAAPHPEILGGEMWENRDIYVNLSTSSLPVTHVNGVTDVTVENGKDVVYVGARSGSTALALYKYTVNDINIPGLDTWEIVGRFWVGTSKQGSGAYDPNLNIFIRSGTETKPFTYWDLNKAGPTNNDVVFFPEEATGQFVMYQNYALDYDPVRNQFVIWTGNGTVWVLTPPEVVSTQGWNLTKQISPSSSVPSGNVGTGVLGKWKYIPNLDAFLGLQNENEGEVWLYKPVGWQNPGSTNSNPTVLLTTPVTNSVFMQGENIAIGADASDSDGSIVRVEFFQGNTKLGESTVAPYMIVWSAPAVGNYILTAVATDDANARTTSTPVSVVVTDGNPIVTMSNPVDGSELTQGGNVTLLADASDSDGSISRVEFFQDNIKLGEAITAPYELAWTVPAAGNYLLHAVATDNTGNTTTSDIVNVTSIEAPNDLPSVSISEPLQGEFFKLGENIAIGADASDSDGSIVRVEFFQGNNKLGESAVAPYVFTWQPPAEGNYTLTAVAIDNVGGSATSNSVNVSVMDGNTAIVELQDGLNGYDKTKDSYISVYHQSLNFGDSNNIKDQENRFNGLYQFAIFQSEGGPIPDGAEILSTTLSLYKHSFYNYTYRAHRILTDWDENQVNWNERLDGMLWSGAGAIPDDVNVLSVADGEGTVGWEPQWLNIDVTNGVQAYSEGFVNYGWRLIHVNGNSNRKEFYSREYQTNPQLRPKLTIEYKIN